MRSFFLLSKKHVLRSMLFLAPSLIFGENNHKANSSCGFCSSIKDGHLAMQIGYYWSYQGKSQHIDIEGLIGDDFTITSHGDSNGFFGLGYFLQGIKKNWVEFDYGVNAFYLANTSVSGNVVQENLFTNLSYSYDLAHYPIYAAAESTFRVTNSTFSITTFAGLGVNFMWARNFKEHALNEFTIPDDIFSSHNTPNFSATAGVGFRSCVWRRLFLELGYRFFYLGQGSFDKTSSLVQDRLSTGNCYGNSLVLSMGF